MVLPRPLSCSEGERIVARTYLINRRKQQARDQKLIEGLDKHANVLPSVVIGGRTYTTAEAIGELQASLDDSKDVQSAKAIWQSAVRKDQERRARVEPFVSLLRQLLQTAFGDSVDVLADFGLAPRKVAIISPEDKVKATEKAMATRKARHTMGKKQKLAITATVGSTLPLAQVDRSAE
jgi:hypothetical protein